MSAALALAAWQRLADGQWHTGVALGETLGVSRAAISQAVAALTQAGVAVEVKRPHGYRLPDAVPLLDPKVIRDAFCHAAIRQGRTVSPPPIWVEGRLDSTNTELAKRGAARRLANGTVLTCEWQHQGRGRRGRAWLAPPGDSLTFSMLWEFAGGAATLSGLSLALSVALADALVALGAASYPPAAGLGVKWPNDLLWQRRKLAGILIESQGDMLGPATVIIGVGLNLRVRAAVAAQIDQPVADVRSVLELSAAQSLDRNAVLGEIAAHLQRACEAFAVGGFAPIRARWQALDACHGLPIRFQEGEELAVGTALGVDARGALMVSVAGKTRVLTSAEVLPG
jgi:BirA family transcriptional regulator, biotin operon repressor / biotin---[acetyl-CoA-carboxylase] ligase